MKDKLLLLDDGKQYLVVDEISYQEKQYLYLIENVENTANVMFCEYNKDELTLVEDKDLIIDLMGLIVIKN